MPEITRDPEGGGSRVVLDKDTRVFQRVTPQSSTMFFVGEQPAGSEVEIGSPEEMASFFYDHERQQFTLWRDSGLKDPQYFKLADLPPIVRLLLTSNFF